MDVQARILAKAQIKSCELRKESILRNERWRSRMLETDIGDVLSTHYEPKDAATISKRCENLEFPHFIRRPVDTYIVAHHNGIIEARIGGIPKPEIKWFQNWHRITESPRYKMYEPESGVYALEIQDAITPDTALYTCVARNCYGCITSSATVRVVHLEIEEYPRFSKRLESTDVSAGHNGHFEVKVTGIPKPEVKWFKNWIPLKENDHIEMRHYDPDSFVLNIYNAQPDDSGLYTCKARNDAGSITTSAMFHVEGKSDVFKSYLPRPYIYEFDVDWNEDITSIRRRLTRLAEELGQQTKAELLHKRAMANYYVKYRRPSYDYYDLM